MTSIEERRERMLADVRPFIERARNFAGWSLDDVPRVRHLDADPPWDYESLAREAASQAGRIVDLGTGGGEVLSRVISGARRGVIATEEWIVNAPVARDCLGPVGVDVLHCESLTLPLRSDAFDLVLARHEALNPAEVDRVLRVGGLLITQQVGKSNLRELAQFFPRRTKWPDHFVEYRSALQSRGYLVSAYEHEYRAAYETIGDIAFLLLVAPWEVPGFEPERDVDALIAMEDALGTPDGIMFTESRYLLVARKPA